MYVDNVEKFGVQKLFLTQLYIFFVTYLPSARLFGHLSGYKIRSLWNCVICESFLHVVLRRNFIFVPFNSNFCMTLEQFLIVDIVLVYPLL